MFLCRRTVLLRLCSTWLLVLIFYWISRCKINVHAFFSILLQMKRSVCVCFVALVPRSTSTFPQIVDEWNDKSQDEGTAIHRRLQVSTSDSVEPHSKLSAFYACLFTCRRLFIVKEVFLRQSMWPYTYMWQLQSSSKLRPGSHEVTQPTILSDSNEKNPFHLFAYRASPRFGTNFLPVTDENSIYNSCNFEKKHVIGMRVLVGQSGYSP